MLKQKKRNIIQNLFGVLSNWDMNTFAGIIPEERDAIIKALNDDAQKLLSEMGPNDPLSVRLREELKLTNDHYYDLLNEMNRPKGKNSFCPVFLKECESFTNLVTLLIVL